MLRARSVCCANRPEMGWIRWCYRVLLLTWPAELRRGHGRELEDAYVRILERARRRDGRLGCLTVAVRGAVDVLLTAPRVHQMARRGTRSAASASMRAAG